ncbi:hypothetical protein M569_09965, partial [Genlisea aurea]
LFFYPFISIEDEAKQLLHISTCQQIDVVRWNRANQEEIACSSMKSSEVYIYDIGYISDKPTEVLNKRPNVTVHGFNVQKGVPDIAFFYNNNSRLLASDTDGAINMWDRRVSHFPCFELTANSPGSLNSVTISRDNEIVYGANQRGAIFLWDLRGGKSYSNFTNHKEVKCSPFMSVKLDVELGKIQSLKAQSNIVSKEIHSIDFDPSCSYQLAFHLDDGWSGVLDTKTCEVSHIHCPPPLWLDRPDVFGSIAPLRKPCWLPFNSIYAVGSSSANGIYLLDFYPSKNSSCHVDCRNDEMLPSRNRNRFLPLSEGVTACASHPLNGTIAAGTRLSSLLMISQPKM